MERKKKLRPVGGWVLNSLLWVLMFIYLESVLHGFVFRALTARYLYVVGFSVPAALLASLLLGLLPRRVNAGLSIALTTLACVL